VSADTGPNAVRDLIGREVESELIATVVDRLPAGGGALVLRGEPGIGKSALLRFARERAEAVGGRPLTTVGVESEAEYAFAGLHQLPHPVLGHAARLPAAQRRALDAAFGASDRLSVRTINDVCDRIGAWHDGGAARPRAPAERLAPARSPIHLRVPAGRGDRQRSV
jgi:hypothetical protein